MRVEIDHPGDEGASKSVLVLAASLAACLSAGYGVLFTVVGDYRDEYGISEGAIGWLIGAGFIVAFVAQIFLAPLGDRGHARKLVVGGVVVNAVGLLLMGFGSNLTVLMIGRLVSGLAIGTASPSVKRIVTIGRGEDLGRNLGWLLSAEVFGFALGPAVSAVLVGPFGLAAPFVVIAVVSLLLAIVFLSWPIPKGSTEEQQRLAVDLLKHGPFAGAVVLGLGVFVMIGAFDALWDVVHTDLGTAD